MNLNLKKWYSTGTPWIWLTAGAVAISIVMVLGLLVLLTVRGMNHFWPKDVMQAHYAPPNAQQEITITQVIGEFVESENIIAQQIISSGIPVDESQPEYRRELLKLGNRDLTGADFSWVLTDFISDVEYPANLVVLERREWGNFYGYLQSVSEAGTVVAEVNIDEVQDDSAWDEFTARLERALALHDEIYKIENQDIGEINYRVERLRLQQRRLELDGRATADALADIAAQRQDLETEYEVLQVSLIDLYEQVNRDTATFIAANAQEKVIELADVVRAYRPNQMGLGAKLLGYGAKLGEFLTDEPREANTEGGIFPAILVLS